MTVNELIERIISAYKGATPEALKAFKPVFYARLQKHEGDALEAAVIDVLANFQPKATKPFPVPGDFEAFLPTGRINLGPDAGPRIDAIGHRERKRQLRMDWEQRQKPGIEAKRGSIVASACAFMAEQIADYAAWASDPKPLRLTAEQIETCQERAISQERVRAYGPIPEDVDAYQAQYAKARDAVLAGKRLKRANDDEPETMSELLERMRLRKERAEAFQRDWRKDADGQYRYQTGAMR